MIESAHIEELWRRYHARLRTFIASRLKNPEDAEDLLQEVFLLLHSRICCMLEREVMEKLIYRITRNLIIDGYRRRRDTEELGDDLRSAAEFPEPEEAPAVRLAYSLRETVEELPEPYRNALMATEYEGLTQAALALREGITLPAVKSRVQRARTKLKRALLDCCLFELDTLGRIIDYRARCCRSAARS